jgi:hypothetical protein
MAPHLQTTPQYGIKVPLIQIAIGNNFYKSTMNEHIGLKVKG